MWFYSNYMNGQYIITGEKIQQLCDVYIGFQEDFAFNPLIQRHVDKHIDLNNLIKSFNNPNLIFCYSHRINDLTAKIHLLSNPFILVTHNSDGEVRDCVQINTILSCANLQKWYAQNLCFKHHKLHLLPIGLANSQWTHGDLSIFDDIDFISSIPIKTKNIYFQFNLSTNFHHRQLCYDSLINKIKWLDCINPIDNLARLSRYKFCICPIGNGADTHRLWEALYLKVVPIVINNEFTQVLISYNIPLVILEKWEDLQENALNYDDYSFTDEKFTKLIRFTPMYISNSDFTPIITKSEILPYAKNIISAIYGGNTSYINILPILLDRLANNNEILISNDIFGDPIVGAMKKLIVIYDDGIIDTFKEDTIVKITNTEYPILKRVSFTKLFDIVIPVGPNDIEQCHRQIQYTKRNIIGYRNIYIISYDPSIQIDACITINENIFPFSIGDVAVYHGKSSRNGWYLQQLLKLYVGFVIPDILSAYLVIDCDTYWLKPTEFIRNRKWLYNFGTECHIPYFEHMKSLHPSFEKMNSDMSGISHHMIFEVDYIKHIIELVESHHHKPFWIVFLEQVVDKLGAGASEYELYFNYVLKYHPDEVEVRKLNWKNVLHIDQNSDLDYVSHHWYNREQI